MGEHTCGACGHSTRVHAWTGRRHCRAQDCECLQLWDA